MQYVVVKGFVDLVLKGQVWYINKNLQSPEGINIERETIKMAKIVIIGGGWAGCAAQLLPRRQVEMYIF